MASPLPSRVDALVVGAGISGLTTAFQLKRAGRTVAVLESTARVGGAIATREDGDWRFELGPNTVVPRGPEVFQLIADCGLADEQLNAAAAARKRFLWKDGALRALPSNPLALLATPLFSARAKLRGLREPWVPRGSSKEESVADFVRRRLGEEILATAVAPFLSGVYAGDPERLSLASALPRLAELERQHGSLIRGLLAGRGSAGPGGKMLSFRRGLSALPERLAAEIGEVHTGTPCLAIRREAGEYRVFTPRGEVRAGRLVLAVPADAAARLLAEVTGGASAPLTEIPYAPVAVACLGVRRSQLAHPLGGFGFLVPRGQGLRILGCLFPSEIFPERAPAGGVALTVFLGGRTDPEIAGRGETEIREVVRRDLHRSLGLSGDPEVFHLHRWPRAIPQYELGHRRFVELAEELERRLPGLHLGGNYLRGISLPDTIAEGMRIAGKIG